MMFIYRASDLCNELKAVVSLGSNLNPILTTLCEFCKFLIKSLCHFLNLITISLLN